jgi:tetratricopeptide (TPR) repeat protein
MKMSRRLSDAVVERLSEALGRLSPPPHTDKFEFLKVLGRGGMGEVWLARDLELGREVALKLLRAHSPEDLERFRREARQQAALKHPSILPIYEIGRLGETPYLAVPYVPGIPISRLDTNSKSLALIFADVCDAVHHAHETGIIHRDLKPANILVEGAKPYVLDFGLARPIKGGSSRLTTTGIVYGTPAYMSPEQASGAAADVSGDLYSLGATLYECLTGLPPYSGDTALKILLDVLHRDPPLPRSLRRTIPVELEAVAMKAMARNRSERYATAREMGCDLRRFAAGEPIAARPYGPLRRAGFWIRRHRVRAGVAVLTASLAATMAWIGISTERQNQERRGLRARADLEKKELAREQEAIRRKLLEYADQVNAFDLKLYIPVEVLQMSKEYESLGKVKDALAAWVRPGADGRADAMRLRARILLLEGHAGDALADLDLAHRLDPRPSDGVERGRIRVRLLEERHRSFARHALGPFDQFLRWTRESESLKGTIASEIALMSDPSEKEIAEAFLKYASGRFQEAGTLLEQVAVRADPRRLADLWIWIGECRRSSEDVPGALEAFRRAQEIKRSCIEAWLSEAELLLETLEDRKVVEGSSPDTLPSAFRSALTALGVAQRINPRHPEAYRLEGEICTNVAEWLLDRKRSSESWCDRAIGAFEKAAGLKGDALLVEVGFSGAYAAKAEAAPAERKRDPLEKAFDHASRATELYPEDYESHFALVDSGVEWAWFEAGCGIDPEPVLRRSESSLKKVETLFGDNSLTGLIKHVERQDAKFKEDLKAARAWPTLAAQRLRLARLAWKRGRGEDVSAELGTVLETLDAIRKEVSNPDFVEDLEDVREKAESLRR